jgi:predicted ferric reductase
MDPTVHLLASSAGDQPTQWLLARASGLLAYLAITFAVVAGLTLKGRLLGTVLRPPVILAIHRTTSIVGLGAVALHAVLIALDGAVDVPLLAVAVPGLSGYRPLATGLGVVAAELWLLIHLSFRMRAQIGARRWRALHVATFPTWAIAALHGITAGTDSVLPWAQQLYVWSIALVLLLVAVRATGTQRPARPTPPRTPERGAPA